MLRTRRNRRHRQFRRSRTHKQRGGVLPPLRRGAIQWPPNEGCLGQSLPITFKVGDMIDRFGPSSGSYVSPMGASADRIAMELKVSGDQPNWYSYTNRGLPYAGISDGGIEGNMLRKKVYDETYRQNIGTDRLDYHTYRVLTDGVVQGNGCVAAPVFNTSGGAIQVKLTETVQSLLDKRILEEIPVTEIPGYFRRNGSIRSSAFGSVPKTSRA